MKTLSLPPALFALFAAVFAIAVLTTAPVLAAQPTPEEMTLFEGHVERGGSHLNDEEFGPGIEELEAARQIVDHPRLAIRIAEAYADWGRCTQAEDEFEALLEREDIDDDIRDGVAQHLDELGDCVAMASLSIKCTPDDARLVLSPTDDAEADELNVDCPYDDEVVARPWTVRAVADGHEDLTESVLLDDGDDVELALTLEEVIEPIAPPDDEGVDWVPIAGYGAMGAGAALLVGGGVLDRRAGDRAARLASARDDGDQARIEALESDARTARIANVALYAGGLTLIAGGLALQFVDFGASETHEEPGVSLGVGPGSLSTTVRW